MKLATIKDKIINDPENTWANRKGWSPIYTAGKSAKVVIIGQAPGLRAQNGGIPWDDASGNNLRDWLGVSYETFYDPDQIALLPMDFYFPGSGERGDKPPRKGFAEKWHPLILKEMPDVKLKILVGQYAHKYYLGNRRYHSLTETVRHYDEYLPEILPLVHPSPRNNIWHKKNPWFKKKIVPVLRGTVEKALK